jgi:hypothetical protein
LCPPSCYLLQGEVQKLLTILNEDLDEEDLRNILMECLKDAPGHDEAAKKEQPKVGTRRSRQVMAVGSTHAAST